MKSVVVGAMSRPVVQRKNNDLMVSKTMFVQLREDRTDVFVQIVVGSWGGCNVRLGEGQVKAKTAGRSTATTEIATKLILSKTWDSDRAVERDVVRNRRQWLLDV